MFTITTVCRSATIFTPIPFHFSGSFLSVPQEDERGEQSEDPPSDVQIEVPPQLQPQPSQSRMARRMSMATAVMAKMADDKASKPDLVQRLNDKFRLIKDPAQFQILERKVEVLAAEKEMLTDYNVALDEENNSLKTMMVELTKSRCRKDLEQLRKRQIDIEKESLTTFPSNISNMMPSPTRDRNHPKSEQENQSRNFVNLQKSESFQQQREQENKSPQMQTPKFNPFQMRQQGNENQRIQSSPMHTFNQLSPMHTANKMSPMHTENQLSPIHTVNQMSSIHRNNQASPPHITNNQNPMYTTNQLGPMHTMNQLSPARTLNPQQSPSRMMNTFVSKAKSLHQQNQNEMRPSYQSDSRGANTNQSELRSMNQTAVVNGISQSTMNSMKQLAMNRFQIPVVGNNIVQTQEQVYHQPANGVGVKATPPPPGDMEPRLLSIPLEEWDKLKYQADLVLEENQVLVDQKKLYKKTIDDLTYEFQTKMKTHSEEILLLMQDKNTLEEELLMTNQDRENAKEELSEIRKNYRTLEEKYGECVSELDKKIDMRIHKEQLDKLNRLKTNEINMSANENNNLKSRLGALGIEKDRLAIKVTDLTAENSELNMRIKITDSELKKTKQKLNQSVIKAEAASCQELIIRKTLSQVIKVAEKTVIDRNLLADIVRQEKLKDNKLKDAINYVYRTTTIDPDTYLHNPEPLSYGDKAQSSNSNNYNGKSYGDKVCGDKGFEYEDNFSDKLSSPLSERDKRLIDFNLGDKTNDLFPTRDNNNNNNNSINNNNYNSDKNKVNDGDKIGEIRGRLNYPVTDLQKFREKHEMELNDLKDMVRMKQSYIDQIQKNLPS